MIGEKVVHKVRNCYGTVFEIVKTSKLWKKYYYKETEDYHRCLLLICDFVIAVILVKEGCIEFKKAVPI
jgi:hypothetical protein